MRRRWVGIPSPDAGRRPTSGVDAPGGVGGVASPPSFVLSWFRACRSPVRVGAGAATASATWQCFDAGRRRWPYATRSSQSPKAPAPSRETARFQWQFRWQYVGAQEGIRGHAKQTKTAQLLETARVLLALPNGFPSWTSPVRPRSPALVGSPCTIRGFRWRASTTRIRRERLSRCARRPGGGHVFSENRRTASSTSMPQSSGPTVPPRRPRRLGRARTPEGDGRLGRDAA